MYTNFKIVDEMKENLYEAQYTVAKKNRVKKFYKALQSQPRLYANRAFIK